jgi:putative ABC transport system substrate-binding protein
LLCALCSVVEAQQAKIPRIGFVSGGTEPFGSNPYFEAFRQGLRDLGYVEEKNILIEYRAAEGKQDLIPRFVAELVQLKVNVLVSPVLPAIRAAQRATKTIPIVMVTLVDPVAEGLVDSLARPGGNITGVTRLTRELSGKRLELLQDALPRISRVGLLWQADWPAAAIGFKEYQTAAPRLKIQLQSVEIRGPKPDLEGAFEAASKGHVTALVTVRSALLNRYPKRIADLAIKKRLPSMHEGSEYLEEGGSLC